jgi:hypothetical protein
MGGRAEGRARWRVDPRGTDAPMRNGRRGEMALEAGQSALADDRTDFGISQLPLTYPWWQISPTGDRVVDPPAS